MGNCRSGRPVSHDCSSGLPCQVNTPALLGSSDMRHRGGSVPKWHLSRTGVPVTSTSMGSSLEAALISPSNRTATACAPTHTKSPYRPLVLGRAAQHQGKSSGVQAKSRLRETNEAQTQSAVWARQGQRIQVLTIRSIHTSDPSWTITAHAPDHTSCSGPRTTNLWGKDSVLGGLRALFTRNQARLGPAFRVSALATSDLPPTLIGKWQPLRRWDALKHT